MADKRIVQYMRGMLKRGYDVYTIRNSLIQQGWEQRDIDAAIDVIYGKHKGTNKIMASAMVLLIVVVAIAGWYITKPKPADTRPAQLLDVTTRPATVRIALGDPIRFNMELSNLGSTSRYDVTITHTLLDQLGNVIDETTETRAMETTLSRDVELRTNSASQPGVYTVQTKVVYGDKQADAAFTVVVNLPSCFDGVLNGDEQGVDCGGSCRSCLSDDDTHLDRPAPSCFDNIQNQGEDEIDCGGPCSACAPLLIVVETPDSENILDEVRSYAAANPARAVETCSAIHDRLRNSCFNIIAKETKDPAYCAYLEDAPSKDTCYARFMMDDDFTVCPLITDNYIKNTCYSLEKVNKANQLMQDGDQQGLKDLYMGEQG